ncbi:MAG: ABC transporter ATP-binding protein [Oscillospiraceae bacterium]|jgi:putative ABC transport system ATP-binding protein|nr:ABC transporter ATP-binding protein [Oscillospiraceae bacterium]
MIKIREICKKYRMGEGIIAALDDVNLDIGGGEFVSITGASGSGKTTLMNILGCLDSPSEGSYILDGEDVSRMSKRRLARVRNLKIGFVFQGFNLIPTLTARENVLLPLIYRKTPARLREKLADEALQIVGLSERAGHRPSQLSGGQQQRVAIARAIAAKPPLILADEPCGSLDSRTGRDIMRTLRGLNEAGRTVVLITHDERAAKTADKIIRISDGRIV